MKLTSFLRVFLVTCVLLPLNIEASPEYVGQQHCQSCHVKEHQQWKSSHHDLAMQEATEKTILGYFSNVIFSKSGIDSRFYKIKDRFMVNTDGADGKLQKGLKENKDAALYHTLGLWYVRNNDRIKGIKALKIAAEIESDNARYQYVYAVAIGEGQPGLAIKILETALQKHSGNIEILMVLVSYYHQQGDEVKAMQYRDKADAVMQYKP
jgi:tetratricopeptide (TPR) repeat protein